MKHRLTRDIFACVEGGGNARVHVNHEVTLAGEGLVAFVDLLGNPIAERISDDGVDQVADPTTR